MLHATDGCADVHIFTIFHYGYNTKHLQTEGDNIFMFTSEAAFAFPRLLLSIDTNFSSR
jgi:hypothetical protein